MSELFSEMEMNMRSIAELYKNSWLWWKVQFLAKKTHKNTREDKTAAHKLSDLNNVNNVNIQGV